MRILFIRHAEPDYAHNTITEKGHREARLLAEIAPALHLGNCYVSPLGRARDTAQYTLQKLNKTAVVCDWLQELPVEVDVSNSEELQRAYPDTRRKDGAFVPRICWDMTPAYLTSHPEFFDPQGWRHTEVAAHSNLLEAYDHAVSSFDALLAKYGYVRDGLRYRVERESLETITCFCHFGLTATLLSHLWNVSPFILWHGLVLAPTSVSEIVSEEREQGIAFFRAQRLGDTTHLYVGNEPVSFSARFCEVYSNKEQRH